MGVSGKVQNDIPLSYASFVSQLGCNPKYLDTFPCYHSTICGKGRLRLGCDIISWISQFAYSWINSKINSNHEITTLKQKWNFFSPIRILTMVRWSPANKSQILSMSYTYRWLHLTQRLSELCWQKYIKS